jgi:hypothetical protein
MGAAGVITAAGCTWASALLTMGTATGMRPAMPTIQATLTILDIAMLRRWLAAQGLTIGTATGFPIRIAL